MVINYTDINKTNNHFSPKEHSKSDGHQLHWHQQNKQYLSPSESLNSDGHQLHQYLQSEQSPFS
jgi:hypothetical protein